MVYAKKLSEQLAEQYPNLFRPKGCYENVYQIVTRCRSLLPEQGKISVLYGYAPFHNDVYVRHAFCLYDGALIEPLARLDGEHLDLERIVPIRKLDYDEYLDALVKDGYYDLAQTLLPDEIHAINGGAFVPNMFDLSDLVNRIAKTSQEFITIWESITSGAGIPAIGSDLNDANCPDGDSITNLEMTL